MNRIKVLGVLVAVGAAGCRGGGTTGLVPDFVVTPSSMSFEGCVAKTAGGATIEGVYPTEKSVTITNNAKVAGTVSTAYSGTDPDAFTTGPNPPTSIGAGETATLPVRFFAPKTGTLRAKLSIDDGSAETKPVEVTLVGDQPSPPPEDMDEIPDPITGMRPPSENLGPTPKLLVLLENKDQLGKYNRCVEGIACQQYFADTYFKETSSLRLKVKNLGCPALKITGIEVLPLTTSADNLAYRLTTPAIAPSMSSPIVLTPADGTTETILTVQFAPIVGASADTERNGILRIYTNDASQSAGGKSGAYDVQLVGSAIAPTFDAVPTECDFSKDTDLCGLAAPKDPTKARFTLRNYGSGQLKVDTHTFKSNNSATTNDNGRFTVSHPAVNQLIGSGLDAGLVYIEVTHASGQSLYVTDTLQVTASAVGTSTVPPQHVNLALFGGKKPCLTTDPADQLDFKDPTTELTDKVVKIQNGAASTCGDLVLSKVAIDNSPYFSIPDAGVPAGTVVKPGQSTDVVIRYKKAIVGGSQTANLRIESNDSDFGPPSWKLVQLFSQSPLDQRPLAVLKACQPSDLATDPMCANGKEGSLSVSLSGLSSKEITLSGLKSTDPGNTGPMPISAYQFILDSSPNAATGASLQNAGLKLPAGLVKLSLDPATTGIYKVSLRVYDDRGQQSPSVDVKIYVFP